MRSLRRTDASSDRVVVLAGLSIAFATWRCPRGCCRRRLARWPRTAPIVLISSSASDTRLQPPPTSPRSRKHVTEVISQNGEVNDRQCPSSARATACSSVIGQRRCRRPKTEDAPNGAANAWPRPRAPTRVRRRPAPRPIVRWSRVRSPSPRCRVRSADTLKQLLQEITDGHGLGGLAAGALGGPPPCGHCRGPDPTRLRRDDAERTRPPGAFRAAALDVESRQVTRRRHDRSRQKSKTHEGSSDNRRAMAAEELLHPVNLARRRRDDRMASEKAVDISDQLARRFVSPGTFLREALHHDPVEIAAQRLRQHDRLGPPAPGDVDRRAARSSFPTV